MANRLVEVSGSLVLEPRERPILWNPPGSLKAAGTGRGPAALDRKRRVL
jgi:hypothetical protein